MWRPTLSSTEKNAVSFYFLVSTLTPPSAVDVPRRNSQQDVPPVPIHVRACRNTKGVGVERGRELGESPIGLVWYHGFSFDCPSGPPHIGVRGSGSIYLSLPPSL